jgi:hypothetical protein
MYFLHDSKMEELPMSSNIVAKDFRILRRSAERKIQYTIFFGYALFLLGFWFVVYGVIRNGFLTVILGGIFFVVGLVLASTKPRATTIRALQHI